MHLKKFYQLELESKEYGFYWPDLKSVLDQIKGECDEIDESIQKNESPARIQEEMGDLLHAAFSLCFYLNLDITYTVNKAIDKYEKRFDKLKKHAALQGYETLQGESIETALALWNQIK